MQGLFQWLAGLIEIQHGRDAVIQRHLGTGQPDCLQMAVDQIAISQVEGRRAHHAVHHLLGIVEEPLVMRTERRAIGDDQRLLARATGSAATLGVVGGSRRHVAQVHSVERGDVHAQLHGGRTEHHRQTLQRRFVSRVLRPVLPILFGIAEALFQQLPAWRIHLGRVFLGLEVEQWMRGLLQQVGNAEVQGAEILIDAAAVSLRLIGNQAPVQGCCVQAPTGELGIDGVALHVAVVLGALQHGFDQLGPFGILPLRDLAGAGAVAPEGGGLDLPQQTGARAARHQMLSTPLFVFRALAEDKVATGIELFVGGEGPAFIQVGVGVGACLVLLDRIEVTTFQAQVAAQGVEQPLVQTCPLRGRQSGQDAVGSKDAGVRAEGIQVAIANLQQAELIQIRVVETPAVAQITQ
ncbi:Uncharacterised protein [Pseudomonas aeruginosa]|nr:Uncharacterised protein [Pseudomonas aeruginosa]